MFTGLADLLRSGRRPSVSLIEGTGLLPRASFYTLRWSPTDAGSATGSAGLLRAAAGVDLMFVDPDKGIEVRSMRVGRKDSSKYITWVEIEGLWSAGCSILIYQHFCCETRQEFAERLGEDLRSRTGASLVEAFRSE